MGTLRNQEVYNSPQIVSKYALGSNLFAPEEVILRILAPRLPTAKMLDMGVGGGRTTLHFAKWVSAYVGTDYSERMIRECRKRFAGYPDHISFAVCDARCMEMFANGTFDFVLFSFNGIDYASHEDRLKILQEARRVGKPSGYFCFSTHNLNWLQNLFELRRIIRFRSAGVRETLFRLKVYFLYNRGVRAATIRNSPYIVLNDGAHGGRLLTYYVKPQVQLDQLEHNFTDIRVFALNGEEIRDARLLQSIEADDWLYYLCRIK
jgi:SAM-dependent methyltransferase